MIDHEDLKNYTKAFLDVEGLDIYDTKIELFLPTAIAKLKAEGLDPLEKDDELYPMYQLAVAIGVVMIIDAEEKNTTNYQLIYRTTVNTLRTNRIKL